MPQVEILDSTTGDNYMLQVDSDGEAVDIERHEEVDLEDDGEKKADVLANEAIQEEPDQE